MLPKCVCQTHTIVNLDGNNLCERSPLHSRDTATTLCTTLGVQKCYNKRCSDATWHNCETPNCHSVVPIGLSFGHICVRKLRTDPTRDCHKGTRVHRMHSQLLQLLLSTCNCKRTIAHCNYLQSTSVILDPTAISYDNLHCTEINCCNLYGNCHPTLQRALRSNALRCIPHSYQSCICQIGTNG